MSVPLPPKQDDIRSLAEQVATSASTPLARFVPSAQSVPDRAIDEWVEREQRRSRWGVRIGLILLGLIVVAGIAIAVWL